MQAGEGEHMVVNTVADINDIAGMNIMGEAVEKADRGTEWTQVRLKARVWDV